MFLTHQQIKRHLFAGTHDRRIRERLLELESAGYLKRVKHEILGATPLIRPTAKAQKLFDLKNRSTLDWNRVAHDALVTSVRLRLTELWDGTWVPESRLKGKSFKRIPDGLFVFSTGRQVAIEVEHTPKSYRRYEQIFSYWEETPVAFVLYVAATASITTTLKRAAEQSPNAPILIIEWAKLEHGAPSVWSRGGPASIFDRRSIT